MKKKKKYKPQTRTSQKAVIKEKPSSTPSRSLSSGNRNAFKILIILLITFIAYLPALKAGFVNWDDSDYVINNLLIKDMFNLKMLFTKPVQGNYHPLTIFSLAINYSISGLNPWSYHLFNLVFHLANCILVFRLAMLLSRNNVVIAFTTALFFGIHPMHVESVAWVSERKDVLYSLFFLAGLISYTKYVDTGSKKQYWLVVLFMVLSLLSKPAAVIFPLVLFCIDLLRKRKFSFRLVSEKIPFFVAALIMGLLTYTAQKEKGAVGGAELFEMSTRILMGFYGIMMYFVKLIVPFNLSPFYPFPPINLDLPRTYYISPLFSVLLVVLVYYSLKRNRIIAFGILFYITNLLLVLQLLPVGSAIIADRYTYIPFIGLFYIAGWLIDRYAKGSFSRAGYIIIPVTLILGYLTYKQSSIWIRSDSLWDHAIKILPSARAYINRGLIFKQEKKYDSAIQYYSRAIKINIADHEAYTNRGNVYFEQKKLDLAYADYQKALSIKPGYFTALDNLGALYGLRGQYDSAFISISKALAVNPEYPPSYKNRGLVNMELNRNEDAIKDFEKSLQYDPDEPDILNVIGVCYRNLKKYNEALATINKAIEIKPDPHFYLNRSYCYNALKDIQSARKDALAAKQGGLVLEAAYAKSLGIQQ